MGLMAGVLGLALLFLLFFLLLLDVALTFFERIVYLGHRDVLRLSLPGRSILSAERRKRSKLGSGSEPPSPTADPPALSLLKVTVNALAGLQILPAAAIHGDAADFVAPTQRAGSQQRRPMRSPPGSRVACVTAHAVEAAV
jgi:hypothetical protein